MKKKTEPIPETETPSNAFLSTLAQVRKGKTSSELSEQMAGVVQAVRLTGKKGEMVLKLIVTPNKDGVSVNVEDAITVKLPKMDRAATLFYATDEGHLQRNDPNQVELQFAAVAGEQKDGEEESESKAAAK